jgi:hypothetical protein
MDCGNGRCARIHAPSLREGTNDHAPQQKPLLCITATAAILFARAESWIQHSPKGRRRGNRPGPETRLFSGEVDRFSWLPFPGLSRGSSTAVLSLLTSGGSKPGMRIEEQWPARVATPVRFGAYVGTFWSLVPIWFLPQLAFTGLGTVACPLECPLRLCSFQPV